MAKHTIRYIGPYLVLGVNVIVTSELIERHSKAKRTKEPAYSRALLIQRSNCFSEAHCQSGALVK